MSAELAFVTVLFAELRVPACHENCLYCKYGIHLLFDPLPVILVLAISTESCIIVVAWASSSRAFPWLTSWSRRGS
ncbi:hypothetical protein V8E52_005298 [Russula decolorans]